MPAAFLGHGSPMNAIENNRFTAAWRAFGADVPRPRAILVVSAHWYHNFTAVTAMGRPRTIHDFLGFPQALFDVEYPALGAPDLAQEVAEIVKPTHIGLDQDSWGLDHGAWSVLKHAFPQADIPVVQFCIDARKDFAFHFKLGALLAPLRERGVLILGSGNVVHNLRALDRAQANSGFDWARRFDDAASEIMAERPDEVATLQNHRDFSLAVPTSEHFIPMLHIAGLAAAAKQNAQILVGGYAMGSLSMTSFTLDASCPTNKSDTRPSAGLPGPEIVPSEDTNI